MGNGDQTSKHGGQDYVFSFVYKGTLEVKSSSLILLMGELSPGYFLKISVFLQAIGSSVAVT